MKLGLTKTGPKEIAKEMNCATDVDKMFSSFITLSGTIASGTKEAEKMKERERT